MALPFLITILLRPGIIRPAPDQFINSIIGLCLLFPFKENPVHGLYQPLPRKRLQQIVDALSSKALSAYWSYAVVKIIKGRSSSTSSISKPVNLGIWYPGNQIWFQFGDFLESFETIGTLGNKLDLSDIFEIMLQ